MGKLFSKLAEAEGAVNPDNADIAMLNCLRFPSPSVNWTFATPGFGLPFGCHAIYWGPPKSGKSLVANAQAGQLHRDDPEALVIKLNTELRGEIQGGNKSLNMFGIDKKRWMELDRNSASGVFDFIEQDVAAMCQAGEKIRLLIVDSITNVQGRRAANADSIDVQNIGDVALTVSEGLKRILPVIRKHKIALISTNHARAELDPKEQAKHKMIKMAGGFALKHLAEYFCYIEPNQSKDGSKNLLEEEFKDPEIKDFMEHSAKTAHKIRFCVTESSTGVAGRVGEFTLDYDRGIVNQHEEVALLAINLGIVERPDNTNYILPGGDKKIRGFANYVMAVRDNEEIQQTLMRKIIEHNAKNHIGL